MDFDKVILANDDEGMHLGLFDQNVLISVVSLFKKGKDMQFRKFATLSEYQGKGYGAELLEYLLDLSRTEGSTRVWCNARKNASGFYSKFGFLETDQTYRSNDRDFVIMEKIL